jgi:hypothetical protein
MCIPQLFSCSMTKRDKCDLFVESMHGHVPFEFVGIGAMHGHFSYDFIAFLLNGIIVELCTLLQFVARASLITYGCCGTVNFATMIFPRLAAEF